MRPALPGLPRVDWTDLLTEPRMVTSLFGGGPSLAQFALEDILLSGGSAKLRGDLGRLPDPLPPRWAARGYTRASVTFLAANVVEAEVSGIPRLHLDAENCLQGDPVDLSVEPAGRSWTAPDGSEHPCVVLSGESAFLTFRFVCAHLRAEVRGYEPAPY